MSDQPEIHTYGRSLSQARSRIAEILQLWEFPTDVVVHEDIQLPPVVRDLIASAREARSEADRQLERWRQGVDRATKRMEREGLSVRDAGELLDLSHQRIHQLRGTPGRAGPSSGTRRRTPTSRRKRTPASTPRES